MIKTRPINPAKGYRIHVNTRLHSYLLPTFAEAHAGTPLEDSQWYPNDPDLKDRETRIVRTLDDLVNVMQTADQERLADTMVIFGTREMPWKKFFVETDQTEGQERFKDLYNRAACNTDNELIPCAMLFEASETKTVGLWHNKKNKSGRYKDVWVKGQALTMEGKQVDFELFHSYMNGYDRKYIREGDLFLVTGMAQRSFTSNKRDTVRVYVDHKDAVRGVTLEELTTLPPPPPSPRPVFYNRAEMGPLD